MLAAGVAGCGTGGKFNTPPPEAPRETIRLTSPAFADGAAIPERFTCDGDELSPPLRWSNVPEQSEELVLLVEDPDAPDGTLMHWTVFGVDPKIGGFREGKLAGNARIGENSFGNKRWAGPCPPKGDKPHRYVFLLYAVVNETGFRAGEVPEYIRDRVDNAGILTRGRLTATYTR